MRILTMCRALHFLLIVGVSISCGRNDQREEATIYAAYAKTHFLSNSVSHAPYDVLVIEPPDGLQLKEALSLQWRLIYSQRGVKVDSETERDFRSRNGTDRLPFSSDLRFDIQHVVMTDMMKEEIFKDGGWDEFYRRFPDSPGIISLSKVGFNWTRTQALLYVGHLRRSRAGEGRIVLFEKKQGQWQEVANEVIWIS